MLKPIFLSISILFVHLLQAQSVGIGTESPASSAKLDVSSTTQGFLPPRMSITERNAIVKPVAGLIIWCTNCGYPGEIEVYNGTAWTNVIGGVPNTAGTVQMCNQVWTSKNLDVVTYRNGDTIPKVTDAATWAGLSTGAWCWYNNDSATYATTYGKLYNWYAVNDTRGLAPAGWHIATNAEFQTLSTTCFGTAAAAGAAMKEAGTTHWQSPNTGATNSSGFTALPGGLRSATDGTFGFVTSFGYFWTSTDVSSTTANYRNLLYTSSNLSSSSSNPKGFGFSVRCVRD